MGSFVVIEENKNRVPVVFALFLTLICHSFLFFSSLSDDHPILENHEQKLLVKLHESKQIVDSVANSNSIVPPEDRVAYLSEHNNRVSHETNAPELSIPLSALSFSANQVTQKGFGRKQLEEQGAKKIVNKRIYDPSDDLPVGQFSNVNTIEYKYFGFYSRIKNQLEQFWGRSVQEIFVELNSRSPSSEDYVTSLTVVLDSNGIVKDILLRNESGFLELDKAAIEAFNKAGPFPNPPKEMLVNDQVIINWEFVVDT